jgi:quercetin dioxygenase-like cupin family protein
MATHHAKPGEIVDLTTWAEDLPVEKSKAIAKIAHLELARLVIGGGTEMHSSGYCQVPGPIVVHCIDGEIELLMPEGALAIRAGQLVYLLGGTKHSIRGVCDSTVLLTIVLEPAQARPEHDI